MSKRDQLAIRILMMVARFVASDELAEVIKPVETWINVERWEEPTNG